MKVGIINKSRNPHPSYKTRGASGLDLQASLKEAITINQGEREAIPTGIHVDLSGDTEAQVRP